MSTTQPLSDAAPTRLRRQILRIPFGLSSTSLALAAIVVLAAVLRFANIGEIGQANTYYTAAVKSMLQSWHNFFFVAAEPGGSVSVDKPPLGLWLQALSASMLGVNGFAVVLPQILAGLASIVLLFHLVRRSFGNGAGLLAALILAITPVSIAVERNNTQDATLIFTLLLAAWVFIKATETRKLRFLILGALLIGIGFNIKMMQALLPLPACYALYFFGSEQGWWRKIVHLGLATLVLIPVALSWAIIVDLTPADQRPYVGSSENNSALNLIIGYNGVQRLLGNGMGGGPPRAGNVITPNGQPPALPGGIPQPPIDDGAGPRGGPGGAGGAFGTGQPGVLRLFQSGLAAQVSWLLPFGLIVMLAMAANAGWRRPQTELQRGLLLWGGWLLTCAVFFSVAGFFHQYYLAMLGPPLAAIVAMGVLFLWQLPATHPARAALLLLVATVATLGFQAYAVGMYLADWWWVAAPVALGLIGLAGLLVSIRCHWPTPTRLSFTAVVVALLVVPAVWSGLTTAYANTSGPMPQAYGSTRGMPLIGPDGRNRAAAAAAVGDPDRAAPPFGGMPGGSGQPVNQNLLNYLQAHTQDTTYLVVVPSSMAGAEYVLATGRPVLYAGGFGGGDPVIDADDLARLVADGQVRYVLWGGGGGPGGNSNSGITTYLQTHGTIVTDASLGTATSATTQAGGGPRRFGGGPGGQLTLYKLGA